MNKYFLIINSIVSIIIPIASWASDVTQFAVLKTDKPCDINVPAGLSKSQVYFSKDCSTAFVLPSEKLNAQISDPILLAGSDDNFCQALTQQSSSIQKYREKIMLIENLIEKSLAKLDSATSDQRSALEAQIREYRVQIQYYQNEIRGIFKPFDDMAAIRVKYTLTSGVMDSVLAFQSANLVPGANASASYPIRIMPAQISDSTLVISNPDSDAYMGRSVLKINFPGFKPSPKENLSDDPNATFVAMNGGLSGIVDISTSAFCRNKAQSTNLSQIVGRSIALNLYYNVKVQTGVKLLVDAKIKTIDFLKNISNSIVKGKFQRREFTEGVLTGGLEGSINIVIDDKGKEYNLMSLITQKEDESELNPLAGLIGKVIKNYFERADDKLKQLGVFLEDTTPRAKEVDSGSEDVVVGQSTVCRRKSGFLGIGASSSCSSQPIIVKMDRDGVSSLALSQLDNSYIQEQILFETNQTSTVLHSSTFVY